MFASASAAGIQLAAVATGTTLSVKLWRMSVAAGFVADPQGTERHDATPQGFQEPQGPDEGPSPEEIQVPVLENVDRAVTGLITGAPPLMLVLVGWQLWN